MKYITFSNESQEQTHNPSIYNGYRFTLLMIPQIPRPIPHIKTKSRAMHDFFVLKTDPNFDTNAPPFEIRGCKAILGGANKLLQIIGRTIKLHFIIFVIFL